MSEVEKAWPPKSPHAALLSSPSGRRKYRQYQESRERSLSPVKRSRNAPNVQRIPRQLLDEDDTNEADELEDDEETLQLKLAAIEAKLKIKKLQQNREKNSLEVQGEERPQTTRPQSSASSIWTAKSRHNDHGLRSNGVEVPVSPTRRPLPQAEQRSPGRVLLGIDKGVKAADISLRRAGSTRKNGTLGSNRRNDGSASTRTPMPGSEFFQESRRRIQAERPIKTFSERMTEHRAKEQTQEQRREAAASKRGAGFRLNRVEMESCEKAAEEARTHNPPRSPLKDRQYATFTREDVLRSQRGNAFKPSVLKHSSTLPDLRDHYSGSGSSSSSTTNKHSAMSDTTNQGGQSSNSARHSEGVAVPSKGDPSLYDPFSQLHLSSRILPHSFLERTFPPQSHTCLRLPQLLKQVTAPAYELPGLDTKDIVIIGVVSSKSTPLDHKPRKGTSASGQGNSSVDGKDKWEDGSQNQKRFIVLQLSDLTWSVDLYLFGTAVQKYHRISPGTVVAILNPGIMPPKKGMEDTGAFSLTLHHGEDALLEVGTARDLGFCVAVKKDGQQCGSWVNLVKTEICEWHLNAQLTKTQAGRMGVNTGSNAIGRGVAGSRSRNRLFAGARDERHSERRRQLYNPGCKFDHESQSHYFITTPSESQRKANCAKPGEFFQRSAASLLELDDDDPFIAEGRLSRDTESRLKKRLLTEEKERDIARKLTSMGSGGAGGEYLRHHVAPNLDGKHISESTNDEAGRKKSAMATKDTIMGPDRNTNGKRAADSVRLSPMKKARFLTEKGIREAGRESMGGKQAEQDDDLDIV